MQFLLALQKGSSQCNLKLVMRASSADAIGNLYCEKYYMAAETRSKEKPVLRYFNVFSAFRQSID